MTIAVCITVRDEVADARPLVASLLEQTVTPDEFVVADGGSRDGTGDLLRQALCDIPNATLIDAPGTNIAQGRNVAIERTRAELIAVTDAGISRPRRWLASLAEAVAANPHAAGSFGYVLAAPTTTFEAALGAVALPLAHEIDPARYPPSSGSVMFRREWLERVGGYPGWLDFGEDLWLDRRVWAQGGWFVHAPGADVGIRPRATTSAFFHQYFNYGAGDGRAQMLGRRHALRYGGYLAAGLLASRLGRWWALFLGALLVTRSLRPYRRLGTVLADVPRASPVLAAVLVPALRVVGDFAKMVGYAAGARAHVTGRTGK